MSFVSEHQKGTQWEAGGFIFFLSQLHFLFAEFRQPNLSSLKEWKSVRTRKQFVFLNSKFSLLALNIVEFKN